MAGFNSVTRVYRQRDTVSRAFGIGMTHPYDMFIVGNLNDFSYVELVLPNGSRVRFDRTSGNSWSNSTLQSVTSPGKFYGAVFSNKNGWTITLRDGTAFTFIQPGIFGPSKYQDVGLTSITDRNGNTLKVIRDSSNYVSRLVSQNGRWMQFTYDSSHRITAAQDNLGRIVQYSYDSQGRLNQVTDANNGIWSYGWDSVNIDQMTSITDPKQTQFLLNHYDVYGRVDRQTQADGTNFRFDYILDSNNNVAQTQVTDPNGNVRIVTFPPPPPSPDGTFVSGGYMANDTRTVGPERQVFTYQRDPSTNLLLSVTDSLNRQTTFTYDGVGNVTSITRLAGTPNAVTTSFAYESTFSQISSITDPLQHKTSFGYDGKGNLTSVTDPVSSTSSFSYNNLGRLVSAADPLGNSLQIVYSGADVSSIIGPSGGNVGAVTDGAGRLTALSDPLGNTTRYQYNALNRLTQQTDALGGVVSLQFDANSNLLNASDPRNAQAPTTYAYDNMDRIQTRIDELGDSTTFVHDGNGNLTCVTDRRGKISVFQYDGLNRLVLAGFGASSCASTSYESTIAYSYDAAGRPTSIVDSVSGTMTPTFDGLDRLASLTTPQGSISYQYDAANREVAMAVRGQSPVTYSYDDAGRLTNIIQGTSSIGLGYDATGRRTALTLPNGVSLTYSYDTESRLASITYRRGTTLLGDLTYSYDTAGAVSKLGGSYAKTELPMAVTSATYDAANRLTNWGGTSLAYDANGNLLSDGANTYAWDARNQLSSISGSVNAAFQYDALGRRVSKIIGGVETAVLYNGSNIVQELTGNTPISNLLTGEMDEVFLRTGNSVENFLTDGLGSTVAITDSTGAVLTQYAYEPFGNTFPSGSNTSNSFQYAGRENDGTGLYYNRVRYYSPIFHRFISQDPAQALGDVNRYAYAENDPIGKKDPSGLFSCSWHKWLKYSAGFDAGYNQDAIEALAQQVCDVDKEPGSQGTAPKYTHQHSMAGKKNGKFEKCEDAYEGTKDLLQRLMQNGDLAHALHLLQDEWPIGHRFKPWGGPWDWEPGTAPLEHLVGDYLPGPDVVNAAAEVSTQFIKDYLNHSMGDPEDYLQDFCE